MNSLDPQGDNHHPSTTAMNNSKNEKNHHRHWQHCNRCFNYENHPQFGLFISPCGHLICSKCLLYGENNDQNSNLPQESNTGQPKSSTTIHTYCPLCQALTRFISIQNVTSLPPEIDRVLTDTSHLMEETMRIVRFQSSNYDRFVEYLKSKLIQQRDLLMKSKQVIHQLKSQINTLSQENHALKLQFGQMKQQQYHQFGNNQTTHHPPVSYQTPIQSPLMNMNSYHQIANAQINMVPHFGNAQQPQVYESHSIHSPQKPARLSLKPQTTTNSNSSSFHSPITANGAIYPRTPQKPSPNGSSNYKEVNSADRLNTRTSPFQSPRGHNNPISTPFQTSLRTPLSNITNTHKKNQRSPSGGIRSHSVQPSYPNLPKPTLFYPTHHGSMVNTNNIPMNSIRPRSSLDAITPSSKIRRTTTTGNMIPPPPQPKPTFERPSSIVLGGKEKLDTRFHFPRSHSTTSWKH